MRVAKQTTAEKQRQRGIFHRIFELSICVKSIDGVLEIVGGVLLLLVSGATLNRLVGALTQHELVEDPRDWIANALRQAAAQLSAGTKLFGSMYLIAHGLLKVFLVVALFRGKLWAYPVTMVFLSIFIAYQIYRLSYNDSIGLMLLTLLDIATVILIWREYRSLTR